jgi:transcriptional regulator with XRE-family HTH domain
VIFLTVGERIRAARKSAGLTQKKLGERMGASYATVQQWETGKRNPKIETLQRIASALGIKMFDLLPKAPRDGEIRIFQSEEAKSQYVEKLRALLNEETNEDERLKIEEKIEYYSAPKPETFEESILLSKETVSAALYAALKLNSMRFMDMFSTFRDAFGINAAATVPEIVGNFIDSLTELELSEAMALIDGLTEATSDEKRKAIEYLKFLRSQRAPANRPGV